MPSSCASSELVRAYPLLRHGSVDQLRRIVRASLASRALGQRVAELAQQRVPVLILGETGTGKTLIANELHGAQAASSFFNLNCASLGDTQLADVVCEQLPGPRESSPGGPSGTLLLDEIGELSPWGQAVLLRALSGYDTSSGPRLVSATHRDLEAMVRDGQFSGELLMRLRGVTLPLSPLRKRPEEIPALALHFLRLTLTLSGISFISMDPIILTYLEQHSWPGNVRELQNAMSSALTRCDDGLLCIDSLPEELRERVRERSE